MTKPNNELIKLFLILSFIIKLSSLYNFDTSNVQELQISNNDESSYFGYSLLLQRGNPSIVIVGAPKTKSANRITGAIYKCILNNNKTDCVPYQLNNFFEGIYNKSNGDFLGAALDGDDEAGGQLYTCAPRSVIDYDISNYFVNGRCFYINNSLIIFKDGNRVFYPLYSYRQVNRFGTQSYYDAAFGESGFDIKFCKQRNELLIGAPGVIQWKGAIIRNNNFARFEMLPRSNVSYSLSYFGYSVTSGIFDLNTYTTWYVAGAPRASGLKGQVSLFEKSIMDKEGIKLHQNIIGEQVGSYFGAVVLTINFNTTASLLIGAPTYSGKTYDEGCVYFYKNKGNGNFENPVKLLGSQQISGRFGSQISNLGDIDLDSFNDIAISAPYENNGVGVVYIYNGQKNGFSDQFSQKLSPSTIDNLNLPRTIRGFGLGLSKGNDIDYNEYNDIAIGAYKSGRVFVLKALPIIDLTMKVLPNVSISYNTKEFSLVYCIQFFPRNEQFVVAKNFSIEVILDERALAHNMTISRNYFVTAENTLCDNLIVKLINKIVNIDPFQITLNFNLRQQQKIIFKGERVVKNIIPFLHGCGIDDICQTNLSLKAETVNLSNITLQLDEELMLKITINNKGETAFKTQLYITVPENVNLINLRECKIIEDGNYECFITERLLADEKKIKIFNLDVSKMKPEMKYLTIHLEVNSLGDEANVYDNKIQLEIPIVLKSNPYMESKSLPEDNLLYTNDFGQIIKPELKFSHSFSLGNLGPSPLNINNISFFMPNMKIDNKEIFTVEEVENDEISCYFTNYKSNNILINNFDFMNENITKNKSIEISCPGSNICVQINCRGDYLYKSSETLIFNLKFVAKTALLVKKYKKQINDGINIIKFITKAILNNGTHLIISSSATLFYGPNLLSIPLWIYIASALIGLILLILLIFLLYKCNFFSRVYKDKLLKEEQMKIFDNEISESDS